MTRFGGRSKKVWLLAALAAFALTACETPPSAGPVWQDPAMAGTFEKGGRDN